MIFETIKTPGVAALSYLVGSGGRAVVIDPRRDVDVYLELLRENDLELVAVLETHRHEDFVVGSRDLAARTGAPIWHGPGTPFEYGTVPDEGDTIELGDVTLRVLRTPGHTDDSQSYVLVHGETSDAPLGVFTGDALFVHDVGRTDFHPEREAEDAATLYHSLHDTLLPLGDGVLVWPAHGAGSVCGDGMADRDVTTLGYERAHNPLLQLDEDAFVERKLAEQHVKPPYFERMEHLNRVGPEPGHRLPLPVPVPAADFAEHLGGQVLDVRAPQAFAGSHAPGSICLPTSLVTAYGGWFLDYDSPIWLIADDAAQRQAALESLFRLGYEDVQGYLKGGITGWETSGQPVEDIPAVSVEELQELLSDPDSFTLLDVRKPSEWDAGHLDGALHVFLGELPDRLDEVPRDKPVVTFCGSGKRAMVAASILRRAGFEDVRNSFGSMKACKAVGCGDLKAA